MDMVKNANKKCIICNKKSPPSDGDFGEETERLVHVVSTYCVQF